MVTLREDLKSTNFHVNTAEATYGPTFGLLFTSDSGHTGPNAFDDFRRFPRYRNQVQNDTLFHQKAFN